VSERRATLAVRFCRSSLRYESHRDPLTGLRQRMRELAQTRVRYGYRRLLVLLRREGWELGKKRCYRLYIEEGLALRRKWPWRHATAVHREQRRPATARNDIWSMDFVADQLADGRRFRALTVLDLFTRECLAIDVGQGLSGRDVVAALEHLRFERGLPIVVGPVRKPMSQGTLLHHVLKESRFDGSPNVVVATQEEICHRDDYPLDDVVGVPTLSEVVEPSLKFACGLVSTECNASVRITETLCLFEKVVVSHGIVSRRVRYPTSTDECIEEVRPCLHHEEAKD
jgi:putative transposase